METFLEIPWYLFAIAGALLGMVTGRVAGDNFEGYFGYTFVGFAVVVVGGFVWIMFQSLTLPTMVGSAVGDIFFKGLIDLSALYVANLVTTWLFRK